MSKRVVALTNIVVVRDLAILPLTEVTLYWHGHRGRCTILVLRAPQLPSE
jgi:hypothetical protein